MTDSNLKMMTGTSHHMDYVQIARQGDLALGTKLERISDGAGFGLPGTTYFGFRVRTSIFPEEKPEGADDSVVVAFKPKTPENFAEAWNGIPKWEKKNSERCSVTMGILIDGKIDGDDAQRAKFYEAIKDGKLAITLAEHMAGLAGDNGVVVHSADELCGYFDGLIKQFVDNAEKALAFNRKVKEEAQAKLGKFMTIQELLHNANEKADAHHDDDADAEAEADVG